MVTVDSSLPTGLEVRSRTGRFLTPFVPELHGLTKLGFRMVLDGELVAVDDGGDINFYRLGERMLTTQAARAATLCAFDVLWLDGIDCTQLPYRERRKALEMLERCGRLGAPCHASSSMTPTTYSTRAYGCGRKASC